MMRELDIAECLAGGLTPEEALNYSITNSDRHYVVHDPSGNVLAVWGFRTDSFLAGTISLWMLSFGDWSGQKIAAARRSLELVDDLMAHHHLLRAYVHAGHSLSLRWLEWLDFHIVATTLSPKGEAFHIMERAKWAS